MANDKENGDDAEAWCSPQPPMPTAHCLGSLTAHNVAEPAADGDGKVEQGEHLAPQVAHKHVGAIVE